MTKSMTALKRITLVLFVLSACVGIDQATKEMARSHLPKTEVLSLAGGALRLDYTENRGGILSFEGCLPERWRGSFLTAVVGGFLGLLVVFLVVTPVLRPITVIALSLLCGGGFSNLLDRVALGGDVVDFLSVGWGGVRSAIFNLADAAITLGTALFVFSILMSMRPLALRRSPHPPS